MKRAPLLLLLLPVTSLAAGIWNTDIWNTDVWDDQLWGADAGPPPLLVPDVVGLSLAAADTALEADGLDTGVTTPTCSGEAANQVLAQNPTAGTEVMLGALVDLLYSNGTPCVPGVGGLPGVGVKMGIGL